MSGHISVCEVDPELKSEFQKFKSRKSKISACIIMKIDPESLVIKIDEMLEDVDIDEIRETLPSHQPRYFAYSSQIQHSDGRVSYPLIFVFTTPRDGKPELQMMYAGSKLSLINTLCITKSFEIRELEELTQEWYESKMKN